MSGRGPVPKPASLRQRQNRSSTHALLPSVERAKTNKVPALPAREKHTERWHPKVLEWWEAVWRSPMAREYVGPDIKGGLYALAELYQRRWAEDETKILVLLVAEIRQQEIRFGLSPIDRRRLQWEIEKGETADERTTTRRRSRKLAASLEKIAKKDPREVLRAV